MIISTAAETLPTPIFTRNIVVILSDNRIWV